MNTIEIEITNVGSQVNPRYQGVDLDNGKLMDGERRDSRDRKLSGWYPGVDEYLRAEYGLNGELEFPVDFNAPAGVTTFESEGFRVVVYDELVHHDHPLTRLMPAEAAALTDQELAELADTIVQRHDPRWVVPSGAFTDLLRNLVKAGRVEAVPTACRAYFGFHPAARGYVLGRVPAIILNNYPPIAALYRRRGFCQWLVGEQSRIGNDFSAAVTSPQGLRAAADGVVSAFEESLREAAK